MSGARAVAGTPPEREPWRVRGGGRAPEPRRNQRSSERNATLPGTRQPALALDIDEIKSHHEESSACRAASASVPHAFRLHLPINHQSGRTRQPDDDRRVMKRWCTAHGSSWVWRLDGVPFTDSARFLEDANLARRMAHQWTAIRYTGGDQAADRTDTNV